MFTALLVVLALGVIITLVGLSSALWMTSKDLEITRVKDPIAVVRPIDSPLSLPKDQIAAETSSTQDRIVRELTNSEGGKITVTLISKTEDKVTFALDGKVNEYPIDKLSEPDQKFIREWQP